MKRLFDIFWSLVGLIIFFPFFIVTAILIKLDSKGPVFFRQVRVGKRNKDFKIFKFRTMYVDSDKKGLLTVGDTDSRVTKIGLKLRKYKIDELPQLINVLVGQMSFVGPRPEVRKYVDMYTEEQKEIFRVRPGITDMASIKYKNENEILSEQDDPNAYYVDVIMPDKIRINLEYLSQRNFFKDIGVIFKTFREISD
jgi:lipopolysaccharide/colanic/teichoic acid biosynthesis glycosyltransferase